VGLILHWLLQVIGFHVMIGFPVNYVTIVRSFTGDGNLGTRGFHAGDWQVKTERKKVKACNRSRRMNGR